MPRTQCAASLRSLPAGERARPHATSDSSMNSRHLNLLCFLDPPRSHCWTRLRPRKKISDHNTSSSSSRKKVACCTKKVHAGLRQRQHGAVAAEERHAQVWFSQRRLLQSLCDLVVVFAPCLLLCSVSRIGFRCTCPYTSDVLVFSGGVAPRLFHILTLFVTANAISWPFNNFASGIPATNYSSTRGNDSGCFQFAFSRHLVPFRLLSRRPHCHRNERMRSCPCNMAPIFLRS